MVQISMLYIEKKDTVPFALSTGKTVIWILKCNKCFKQMVLSIAPADKFPL